MGMGWVSFCVSLHFCLFGGVAILVLSLGCAASIAKVGGAQGFWFHCIGGLVSGIG